jgi:hypothetical protein
MRKRRRIENGSAKIAGSCHFSVPGREAFFGG